MKRSICAYLPLALVLAAVSAKLPACDLLAVAVFPAAANLPEKQSMKVFGQTIRYYDIGRGPTVVLLHGTGDRAESWAAIIPTLAKSHRVIAMDQLGFGESDKPLVGYRIETWVNMLGEMLRLKSVSHFTLVGESLGGWIAAQYVLHSRANADAYPQADKLILTDAAGIKPMQQPVNRDAPSPGASIEATVNGLRGAYYDPKFATTDAARRRFALTLETGASYTIQSFASSQATSDEYVDDKLRQITIPTLVVRGEQDHVVSSASAAAYTAGIPNARFVSIPKCGHLPPVEQPGTYLAAIAPFIGN